MVVIESQLEWSISSPLARGTRGEIGNAVNLLRFIPAGAGNITPEVSSQKLQAVYPRWRGEHHPDTHAFGATAGLSPLARGTCNERRHEPKNWRFIPAGAGNMLDFLALLRRIPVYPRWRGEHCPLIAVLLGTRGLSPLARGTCRCSGAISRNLRFIPAGAGNIRSISYPPRLKTVYPRWRGEHWSDMTRAEQLAGLSPLARGTLLPGLLAIPRQQFIPAGAGNMQN